MRPPTQPPTQPQALHPPDGERDDRGQRVNEFMGWLVGKALAARQRHYQGQQAEPGRENPTNQDADQGNVKGCSPTSENSPAGGPRDDLDNLTS